MTLILTWIESLHQTRGGTDRDLHTEPGCDAVISAKGPRQAGRRWPVERTNSWHNRGFGKLLACTEQRRRVIKVFIALANAVIIIRRLVPIA